MLLVYFSSEGYPSCSLKKNGKYYSKTIHPLVLEAFKGPRPPKYDACHIDGSRTNNHISNLKWATRKENVNDMVKHKSLVHGEKHPNSKLTNAQVLEARKLYKSGISGGKLMKKYGVSKTAMYYALNKTQWKYI